MDIDPTKYKDFVLYLFKSLRELETELMAHRLSLESINVAHPELEVRPFFQKILNSPQLQERMKQKYDPIVEDIQQRLDLATLGQDLERLMKEWKPEGPVN